MARLDGLQVNQERRPNFRSEGRLFLVRCFACGGEHGFENWASVVALGICARCGWRESPTTDEPTEE